MTKFHENFDEEKVGQVAETYNIKLDRDKTGDDRDQKSSPPLKRTKFPDSECSVNNIDNTVDTTLETVADTAEATTKADTVSWTSSSNTKDSHLDSTRSETAVDSVTTDIAADTVVCSTNSTTKSPQCWSEYLTTHMLHHKGLKHSKPWQKATCNPSPETRYMQLCAFAARDVDSEYPRGVHIVVAACSDGFVRVFGFQEKAKKFSFLAHSSFHDHCVLCVKHHIPQIHLPSNKKSSNRDTCNSNPTNQSPGDNSSANHSAEDNASAPQHAGANHVPCNNEVYIMSSATDGRMALWDVGSLVEDFCRIIIKEDGDTDSEKKQPNIPETKNLGSPALMIEAHQSGVNAIDILETSG